MQFYAEMNSSHLHLCRNLHNCTQTFITLKWVKFLRIPIAHLSLVTSQSYHVSGNLFTLSTNDWSGKLDSDKSKLHFNLKVKKLGMKVGI